MLILFEATHVVPSSTTPAQLEDLLSFLVLKNDSENHVLEKSGEKHHL